MMTSKDTSNSCLLLYDSGYSNLYGDIVNADILVVGQDYPKIENKNNTKVLIYEDFLSKEDLAAVDKRASAITREWCIMVGHANFPWFPIGLCWERSLRAETGTMLKISCFLAKSNYSKYRIVDDGSSLSRTVLVFARNNGIDVELIQVASKKMPLQSKVVSFRSCLIQLSTMKFLFINSLCTFANIIWKLFNRKKKSVLIFPYRHSDGIMDGLIGREFKTAVILANPSMKHIIRYFGKVYFYTISFTHQLNKGSDASHEDEIELLKESFRDNFSPHLGETFGVDWSAVLQQDINRIVREDFSYLCKFGKSFAGKIKDLCVKEIFVSQDSAFIEKACVLLGHAFELNSSVFQHAAGDNYTIDVDPVAKYSLVWDHLTKKEYYQKLYSIQEDRFCFYYNRYIANLEKEVAKITKESVFRKLGWDSRKKTILYLPEVYDGIFAYYSPYEAYSYLKNFCHEVSKLTDVQVLIRFHPSASYYEDLQPKIELIQDSRSDCIVNGGLNLLESLCIADVVIGTVSTALFEAVAANKPVVIYNRLNNGIKYSLISTGAAIHIDQLGALVEFPKLLDGSQLDAKLQEGRKEFLSKNFLPEDNTHEICHMIHSRLS